MNQIPHSLSSIPTNLSYLSSKGHKLFIRRCPNVVYFTQKVNIPGIMLPMPGYDTPFITLPQSGDHVKFNMLTVEFIVDESLNNWLEIHSWMRNIGKVDDFSEFEALEENDESGIAPITDTGIKSEITLSILNSAMDPFMHFYYHDCMPTSLSDLVFDTTLNDVKYLTSTVEFVYSNYDYERVQVLYP